MYNSAKPSGMRKAIPLYFIEVYLKEGSVRKFTTNGQYIKEKTDFCFDMGNAKFIDSIWTELNVDHLQSVKYVFEDYIKYQESTDSQDNKNLMKNNLESLNLVKGPSDLELLINVWLYYDPTDFPTRKLVFSILKESKPESVIAIKKRQKNKKEWEREDSAPYSELDYLLTQLEKE